MRLRHVATFAAFTAGLTAASALHRRADRRAIARPPATTSLSPVLPVPVREGVVLPFVRPAETAPVSVQPVSVQPVSVQPVSVQPASARPAGPARCGDSGGRTKAGAPCAARATGGGRCHHHPIAA
jgi:hypothetical protein